MYNKKKYFKEYTNTSLKYILIYRLFQGGVCSSSNAKKFFYLRDNPLRLF